MKGKKFTAEQIITKLREAVVLRRRAVVRIQEALGHPERRICRVLEQAWAVTRRS